MVPAASRLRVRALVVALVALSAGSAFLPQSAADGHGVTFSTQIVLQPCVAGGGDCSTPPVTTGDGRIFVQLIPVYAGTANVYLEGDGLSRTHQYTCVSPPATDCSRLIQAPHAGTYIVTVRFESTARGALLLEAVTPS